MEILRLLQFNKIMNQKLPVKYLISLQKSNQSKLGEIPQQHFN